MARARWLGLPLFAALCACGRFLGYDELSAREPENAVDARAETANDGATDTPPPAPTGVRPPERPAGARTPSGKGKTVWLLISQVHVGLRTVGGEKLPGAWQDWGYDLDGVCTGPDQAADSKGTCKRAESSEPNTNLDGNLCRDNNFGAHLAPILDLVYADFDKHEKEAIAAGAITLLLVLDDLDDGVDDPYVPGRLYKIANWAGTDPPKLDGSDVREVESESVIGDDLSRPKTAFPGGYLKGNVWVSGEPIASLSVTFPSADVHLQVELAGGLLTLGLSADHRTGGLGLVTGAVPLSRVESIMKPIALRSGFCPGDSAYKSLLANAMKVPDVVQSAPSLHDPTKPCDAISFALGFGVTPIQPVTTVVPSAPEWVPPDCDAGDAGTDG